MKKPLVYYAISLFTGCLCTLMLLQNFIGGAVIAASFFAILFFTIDKNFFYINTCFFFIGALTFTLYFNVKVPKTINVRIMEKSNFYCLSEYKGRKLILKGNVKKLKEGEKIIVHGKFEKEKDLKRGIIGVYKVEKYKSCKKDVIYYLYDIKRNIYIQFKEILGEEKSSVIMSLCYGDTQYLSKNQKNQFQKLGVFHAVSVSGFHMAIIYKVLERFIGLKLAVLFSFVYLIFTGMEAATVRAFIMILIFKLSKMLFKNYDSLSSLSLAALVLILVKPYYITDIGFMLSFLATLGILLYYKKTMRLLYKLPQKLNESLSITLSSQIFSVPYIAFTIQNFSSGFIFGNLFLLPMYSIIVVLGNIALLTCWLQPLFKIMCSVLNLIITAVEGANHLILDICPSVSYLTYLDGVALVLVFISCLMYNHGYKQYKYLPFMVLLSLAFQNYNFVPQIYYVSFQKAEVVIIKYKKQSTMICNYEQSYAKELINLKEQMKVDKVITNIDRSYMIKLNRSLYIKIAPYYKDESMNICIYSGKHKLALLSNSLKKKDVEAFKSYDKVKLLQRYPNAVGEKYLDYSYRERSNLYAIIFNEIYKID